MAEHAPLSAYVAPDGALVWDVPAAVVAFCRQRFAGTRVEVTLRAEGAGRTKKQSDGFHAMIAPWARERGWSIDALKQVILREVFGTIDHVHPRTGEVIIVLAEPHTSTLTKAQFIELIDRALQLAAEEDGIMLTAPDEYRRQQAERQQRAARQQAAQARGAA